MRTLHVVLIIMVFGLWSCSNGGGPANVNQVKEYKVAEVKIGNATLEKEYLTLLEGQQTVEIRPRISGYLEQILVDEGDFVRKGQILFRINADDIQAMVRSAEAQVKVAEAQVETAKINLDKTKPLVEKKIVSEFNQKQAEAGLLASESQLAQAKANLANAKVNLQYAAITSPADGIIGTFPYKVGSLVSSSTQLTSISNTTNMFAYFSMNEKEYLSLINKVDGRTRQEKIANLPKVSLVLADKSIYELPGIIEAVSGLVDTKTGSVNLRATFPNPNQILSSGSSGKIRFPQYMDNIILIPQRASFELQGKNFVYMVDKENKVKNVEVTVVSGNLKDNYVVTSGLKAGDRIVIEGIGSLRNDAVIKPVLTEIVTVSK